MPRPLCAPVSLKYVVYCTIHPPPFLLRKSAMRLLRTTCFSRAHQIHPSSNRCLSWHTGCDGRDLVTQKLWPTDPGKLWCMGHADMCFFLCSVPCLTAFPAPLGKQVVFRILAHSLHERRLYMACSRYSFPLLGVIC